MDDFTHSDRMNRPIQPDALAALRAATDSRHTLLDSGLAIGAPDASLGDYVAHLSMLAPLAEWLAGFSDGPQAALDPDFRLDMDAWLRARLALIDADLLESGNDPDIDPATPPAAPSAPWPAQASAAYRWGVCYVVEGSQLGGAVLYARLHDKLAPHPLRYLKGDGIGPGPRWRLFMQALRAHVRTPAEIADACLGACDAFDRILATRAHLK
jgi:heme oxygenase